RDLNPLDSCIGSEPPSRIILLACRSLLAACVYGLNSTDDALVFLTAMMISPFADLSMTLLRKDIIEISRDFFGGQEARPEGFESISPYRAR
ncbi:MAG: hypothetical protein ABIJ26_00480, partial [Candidatus Margulisiibacteriota bacterium]